MDAKITMNIRGELAKVFYALADKRECGRFREEKPENLSQFEHIEEREVVWNTEILPMNCGMATELYLRSQSHGLKYIHLESKWTYSDKDFQTALEVFARAGVKSLTMCRDTCWTLKDVQTLLQAGWYLVFSVELNIPTLSLTEAYPVLVFMHN